MHASSHIRKIHSKSSKHYHIYFVTQDKLIISSEFYYIPVYQNLTNLTKSSQNLNERHQAFKTSWKSTSSTKTCLNKGGGFLSSCPVLGFSVSRPWIWSSVSTSREARGLCQNTKIGKALIFKSGEHEKQNITTLKLKTPSYLLSIATT